MHPELSVEVAFTTGALDDPVWEDITGDVRNWDTLRGRQRELERFQPGRATVVLSNLERQYDSTYADGPWYGNLRPMRRMRIRETYNGTTYPVFDGFVDRWHLAYPDVGHDATATVIATDAFKVMARTDLPPSVYAYEISEDDTDVYWRLDETLEGLTLGEAVSSGAGGDTYDAAYTGVPSVGAQGLVVNDPGSSMFIYGGDFYNGAELQGITIPPDTLDLLAHASFAIEGWFRVEALDDGISNNKFLFRVQQAGTNNVHLTVQFTADADGTNRRLQFTIISAASSAYVVVTPVESVTVGQVHHVVAAVEATGQMALYLDGVRYTTLGAGVGTSLAGVTRLTGGTLTVGYDGTASASPLNNWQGEIDDVSILLDAAPAQADVSRHYEAGTHPWQDDLPGARIGRVLDLVGWPAARRELDTGLTVLQSATLDMPALEHLQTVAETEYGLLFVDRTGNVRFDDRTAVLTRDPGAAVYGDGLGEVGYRAITPDDGDEVIRNRALISRLNGAVRRADDATSVAEFGRFDYRLEGLYHRHEVHSQNYADLIVSEYAEPRRRITALDVGPPIDGDEDIVYPAMLGPELGDVIVVSHNPTGGGDPFTQACAVEGIAHAGAPGGVRTVRFILSPALVGFWRIGVAGASEIGETTRVSF
jgi:hypothetical protein